VGVRETDDLHVAAHGVPSSLTRSDLRIVARLHAALAISSGIGYDPLMRRLIQFSAFAAVMLAGVVVLAAVLWQFAAIREAAVDAATVIGAPAVPLLLDALDDEDKIVQVRAGLALREIGPAAVPVLLDSLAAPRPDRRRQAALALGIIEAHEAIPQLIEGVRSEPDKGARLAAMRALQPMGRHAVAAIPAFLEVLANPDADLRATAAECLGFSAGGDRKAIAALVAVLGDSDARVHSNASHALTRMRAIQALERAAK
jgi:HEAT repeat protein